MNSPKLPRFLPPSNVCNGATSGPLFSPWLPPSLPRSFNATVVTLLAAVLVLPAAAADPEGNQENLELLGRVVLHV